MIQPNLEWHCDIFATHEEKQKLSHERAWLGENFPGVALPYRDADGKWIQLRYAGINTIAQVMDLGPWCIDDISYIMDGLRPRAEKYIHEYCPYTLYATPPDDWTKCNGAGIDLFPRVAKELEIEIDQNVRLDWRFIDLDK